MPRRMRAAAAGAVTAGAACVAAVRQEAFVAQPCRAAPTLHRAAALGGCAAAERWGEPLAGQGARGLAAGAVFAVAAAAQRRGGARARAPRRSTEDEAPELVSERDIDYSKLKELLAEVDFRKACQETRDLLIKIAGPAAVKRGWVYYTEVRGMPEADISTIENLWQHYSKGKFGWVQQRKIWRKNREQFDKFALEVSWFTDVWKNRNWPDEFVYNLDEAAIGHLPLTNCIRGAQVLQELLAHPAIASKKAKTVPKASSSSNKGEGDGKPPGKRSALSMLALGGRSPRASAASPSPATLAGAWASGASASRATARAATAMEEPQVAANLDLSSIKMEQVINQNGFVLPEIPEGTKASAFVIFDAQSKPQYLGFSKDLRNTLRTLLCRRPEWCYKYKCEHLTSSDSGQLLELRKAWINDLGLTPPGNKDARQKNLWENAVDGGAITERAYRIVAEQKAKQIFQQLKDRGLKEQIEFKEDLLDEGKVDVLPSELDIKEVAALASSLSNRTSSVEREVCGNMIKFEIFYDSEFEAGGGYWFDVEVSADQQKSSHRIIVGKDMMQSVGASDAKEVVENAFAVLLWKKVPRHTNSIITSEVFPVNYFTASNVVEHFPEFLGLFDRQQQDFDYDRNQWNFRQVHDYSQDDKRTIPAGPNGGVFDPAAFM